VAGRGRGELTSARTAVVSAFSVSMAGSVAAMALGRVLAWPDYVHVDHGMPFTWGTHVLNTFIGPVDKWVIDYGGLGLDLVVWGTLVSVVTLGVWQLARRRSTSPVTKTP
jgi:hypothetical protein